MCVPFRHSRKCDVYLQMSRADFDGPVLYVGTAGQDYNWGSKLCLRLLEGYDSNVTVYEVTNERHPSWLRGTPTLVNDENIYTGSHALVKLHEMSRSKQPRQGTSAAMFEEHGNDVEGVLTKQGESYTTEEDDTGPKKIKQEDFEKLIGK